MTQTHTTDRQNDRDRRREFKSGLTLGKNTRGGDAFYLFSSLHDAFFANYEFLIDMFQLTLIASAFFFFFHVKDWGIVQQ